MDTGGSCWYIGGEGNQPAGPFSAEQIIESWCAGSVDANTVCWREGMAEWLPLSQVEPFALRIRSTTGSMDAARRGAQSGASPKGVPSLPVEARGRGIRSKGALIVAGVAAGVALPLLLVLALLLAAMQGAGEGIRKRANIKTAQSQVGLLRGALEHYALDMNTFRATEQGLRALSQPPVGADAESEGRGGGASNWGGPYLNKDLPKDPWGNDYRYAYPPERGSRDFPDIWSLGPDRKDNTDDDVCSWDTVKSSEVGEMGREAEQGSATRTKLDIEVVDVDLGGGRSEQDDF